jgi:hypothetical protein
LTSSVVDLCNNALKIFDMFISQECNFERDQAFYRILEYVGTPDEVFLFFAPDLLNIEVETTLSSVDEDVLMALKPLFSKNSTMISPSSRF